MLQLTPVSWFDKSDWLANKRSYEGMTRNAGVTAEDVEKHVPLLAAYADGELHGVDYERGWAMLIPIIKDQRERIEALEEKVAALV